MPVNTVYILNYGTDFSDSISNKPKTGYLVDRDDYEYDMAQESLSERFSRLQNELNDFKNEISRIEVSSCPTANLQFIRFKQTTRPIE
jgi:hypothetical protein